MRAAWVASLVAGLALTVPFDRWFTLVLGIGCLLAFVVIGVFLLAGPGFVAEDEDGSDGAP